MSRRVPHAAGVVLALVLAGCSAAGPAGPQGTTASPVVTGVATPQPTRAPASGAAPSASGFGPSASQATGGLVLVALGDSGTTGHGDPSGNGWVQYYGDLVAQGLGRQVTVRNLARDGTSSAQLVTALRTDASLGASIADADIVVIGIGGNDLNEGDAAMEAGSCTGTACYDGPAATYGRNLDAVAKSVNELRAGKPMLLRAIGMPNGLTGAETVIPDFLRPIATDVGAYQAQLFDDATCAAMDANDGACARLRAVFNGPEGTGDAYAKGLLNLVDCCYANEAGHRLIAQTLYATGLGPHASGAP